MPQTTLVACRTVWIAATILKAVTIIAICIIPRRVSIISGAVATGRYNNVAVTGENHGPRIGWAEPGFLITHRWTWKHQIINNRWIVTRIENRDLNWSIAAGCTVGCIRRGSTWSLRRIVRRYRTDWSRIEAISTIQARREDTDRLSPNSIRRNLRCIRKNCPTSNLSSNSTTTW